MTPMPKITKIQKITNAFTLIELLIVVIIIAILAALATPHFLEQQTRAKVATVKANFRATSIAMEAYYIENGVYPANEWSNYDETDPSTVFGDPSLGRTAIQCLWRLTTPIAYISGVDFLKSPFSPPNEEANLYVTGSYDLAGSYWYASSNKPGLFPWAEVDEVFTSFQYECNFSKEGSLWIISDRGPDLRPYDRVVYDPTNGTLSTGDISRFGP